MVGKSPEANHVLRRISNLVKITMRVLGVKLFNQLPFTYEFRRRLIIENQMVSPRDVESNKDDHFIPQERFKPLRIQI